MTERAIILCKGNILGIKDFPVKLPKNSPQEEQTESVNMKLHEIGLIQKALKSSGYNQQAAADALGIHRDALSRKMKKYNIGISRSEG